MSAKIDPSASTVQEQLLWAVDELEIEIPSWGFLNTGTRFKVWQQAGTPRTVEEKIDDCGTVRRYTGIAHTISLHIPWDKTDDYTALLEYINSKDMGVGGINLNTFQDPDYMLGSMCHPDPEVRDKALAALKECCEIAEEMGATVYQHERTGGIADPARRFAVSKATGDWIFIPAHTPHRLIAASPLPRCLWLAVHLFPAEAVV